jgi:RNA polymerase sigma factor (sigma-70 family)
MATDPMSEVIRRYRSAVLLRDRAGLTDGQLLECFVRGRDQAALGALVRRHGPTVWGVCRRLLGNYHDAEDAFQATFLVLARRADSVRPRDGVAGWLYGVARRTALKARAAAARRRTRERQVGEVPEPEAPHPGRGHDLLPFLDEALSRLPGPYRVTILLCDLEGKTRREAARQLGLPEGTVASRLARARALLAKRLARLGPAASFGLTAAFLSPNAAPAGVPAAVVCSTIDATGQVVAGRAAATGVVSPDAAALAKGVLRSMTLTKLKAVTAAVLVLGLAALGGGLLVRHAAAFEGPARTARAEAGSREAAASKQEAPKDERESAEEKPKEGGLNAVVEKVDATKGTITVSLGGKVAGGIGDPRKGGLGVFELVVRLENLPVAKNARVMINGKEGTLVDLKPQSRASLRIVIDGDIRVTKISAKE